VPSSVFEPAIQETKRLQTYALDPTATGIGLKGDYWRLKFNRNPVKKIIGV
jgi:hypothetical protein